jgi:hypothetical protein
MINKTSMTAIGLHASRVIFAYALLVGLVTENAYAQPPGSYQQSCGNIFFDGRTLTASCRDMAGGTSNSTLDVTRCTPGGDIFNANGTLECSMNGTLPPPGSYQLSCQLFRTIGFTLIAQCKNDNGDFVGDPQGGTQLPGFNRCIGDILNFDAQLVD